MRRAKKFTYEQCLELAKNYTTLYELIVDDFSLYQALLINKWLDKIVKDAGLKRRTKSGTYSYTNVLKIAKRYNTSKDWREGDNPSYRWAKQKNHLKKIYEEASFINPSLKEYTFEECLIEAGKYQNRREWEIKNHGTFYYSEKKGWMDDIAKRVGYVKNSKKLWWYNI